jgi:hypothetical protein
VASPDGKQAADVIGGATKGGFDLLRIATVRDAGFIRRTVTSCWQDAYSDFLPWSFLASLERNPHHNRRAWVSRIAEPASVTWIICQGREDVGALRIIAGASTIPGTDSQLTTLYLLPRARGMGSALRLWTARGPKHYTERRLFSAFACWRAILGASAFMNIGEDSG